MMARQYLVIEALLPDFFPTQLQTLDQRRRGRQAGGQIEIAGDIFQPECLAEQLSAIAEIIEEVDEGPLVIGHQIDTSPYQFVHILLISGYQG